MRILLILLLLCLPGCASGPTLVELEDQVFACTRDKAVSCEVFQQALDDKYEAIDRAKKVRAAKQTTCRIGAHCYYVTNGSLVKVP